MPLRKTTVDKSPHASSSSASRADLRVSDAELSQAHLSKDAQIAARSSSADFAAHLTADLQDGYAHHAIRLERTLGWVLWICLAIVLILISL